MIIIDSKVTITSKTSSNIAEVNNPVILATLDSSATIHIKYGSGISGAKLVALEGITLR